MASGPPRSLKGMHDVVPPVSSRWTELIARFAMRAEQFGYSLVITPVLETLDVFQRVGESTDIVRKEMYTFEDRDGTALAVRPELTAGVARAFVQLRPDTPWKVWYVGPNFRHERPQKGRLRQHFQVGAEVFGVDDPEVDVELIALAWGFYRDLGLQQYTVALNSLGDATCRPAYLELLRTYLRGHRDELCADSQARLEDNPLRVLDCKKPQCIAVTERAPQLLEHLCPECEAHFERVQQGLRDCEIAFEIAPRLVRGLDYYTRTLFEFPSAAADAAQNALGGGGRYDGLVEEMGGPPTPGIGFGSGVERLLLACDAEGVFAARDVSLDVFVVDLLGGGEAVPILHDVREAGLAADRAYGGRSAKAQFRAADKAGARYALVVGRDEIAQGVVTVRDLAKGEDFSVPRDHIVPWLLERKEPLVP